MPLFSIPLLLRMLLFLLRQGHEGCVRTLLLTGANRDAKRGLDDATPLHQVRFVLLSCHVPIPKSLLLGFPSALNLESLKTNYPFL